MRMYFKFYLCATNIKGRKWREFHNELFHFLYGQKQQYHCLSKLQLKREQKRSDRKSTPYHCLRDLSRVPFVVAQSICNEDKGNWVLYISDNAERNSVLSSHTKSLTDMTSSNIKGHRNCQLFHINFCLCEVKHSQILYGLTSDFWFRCMNFVIHSSENLEDILFSFSVQQKHALNQVYICYL